MGMSGAGASSPAPVRGARVERDDGAGTRLGVVHIPKCGGAAARAALSGVPGCYLGPISFDLEQFVWVDPSRLPASARDQVATNRELRQVAARQRLVMGHYAAMNLVGAGCDRLAVQVREPRARLLSRYRFCRAGPQGFATNGGPGARAPSRPPIVRSSSS